MQKRTWTLVGTAALAATLAGCGTEKPAPPSAPIVMSNTTEKPGQVVEQSVVQAAARVVKVDQKDRVVTLKNSAGEEFDVQVGEEVRNLPQVKKGDEVVVSYYESTVITLHKKGEAKPAAESVDAVGRAKAGEKPGGIVGNKTSVTATVVGLDRKKGTVTLKGPQGKVVTVTARDPKRLDPVQVGDLIEVEYTAAVAISVEKPAAKK